MKKNIDRGNLISSIFFVIIKLENNKENYMILQIILLILLFIYTIVFIYAITHHLLILKKELITKNKIYIKKVDKLEENY